MFTQTKSRVRTFLAAATLAIGAVAAATPALASGDVVHIERQKWSFSGAFGTYDKAQLQRGFKVYKEVCSACHGMGLVSFRNLVQSGGPEFSEAQVKALIKEAGYETLDGPNDQGEMFKRPSRLSDRLPSPFPNPEAARAANNGAYPPDFSMIAKARAVAGSYPGSFLVDGLTLYAEHGPDYIYNLITGYKDAPKGHECADGLNYNDKFLSGTCIAMAAPISDDQVTYEDGSKQTVDQYARDVSAFLNWAAEPKLNERKQIGFLTLLFLTVLAGLLYLTTRKLWSGIKH
ncbi:MAG: cytochrome c1 [Hyphomicrobiaceae bacterium]|nr:cytochrome c1 [Hyphomicrobiaceae bacterium]